MNQPVVLAVETSVPLVERLVALTLMPQHELPREAWNMSALWLLDWLVSVKLGSSEQLSAILRDTIAEEGGRGFSSVVGGQPAPARAAAMVNAAAGHAIDLDDTHLAHVSHGTTAVYAAALAAGEMLDCQAEDVRAAFLVGAEVSLRIGSALGASHHDRGFDLAATAGAFGATAAAARILGLSGNQIQAALGLCSTRASGLRGQFRTMGKAYNLGAAAATGVECALLARRGFTSVSDGLTEPAGFLATHSDTPQAMPAAVDGFLFGGIRPRLHGSCYGTHAMIEALMASPPVVPAQIDRLVLRVAPRWLTVCNISTPRTGLEVAFSFTWLAAMVFHGRSTQCLRLFSNALTRDRALVETAAKIRVTGDTQLSDMQVAGEIVTLDGRRLPFAHDLAEQMPQRELRTRMISKARASLIPEPERLVAAIDQLDDLTAREIGALLSPRQAGGLGHSHGASPYAGKVSRAIASEAG